MSQVNNLSKHFEYFTRKWVISSLFMRYILICFLYLFIISILILLITRAPTLQINDIVMKANPALSRQNIHTQTASQLPAGFVQKIPPKNNVIPGKTVNSNNKPSVTPVKSNASSNKKETPAVQPLTAEDRDMQREMYMRLLAKSIIAYQATYGDFPTLYADKSKKTLMENPSETVYLYTENLKTSDAIVVYGGTKSTGFTFTQVSSCDSKPSVNRGIHFQMDINAIIFCSEAGGIKEFSVLENLL